MNIKQHLKDRHFDLAVHTAWVDEAEGVAVFPLWDLSHRWVGYQQYRPEGDKKRFNNPKEGRYFTWRHGKIGVWGLESWKFSNTLFITEGIFDACRLTERGYSAIAMVANDLDKMTKNWLWTIRAQRPVVAVCDNDDNRAGHKLAKAGHTFHMMDEFHDMGDASDEYVTKFLSHYR